MVRTFVSWSGERGRLLAEAVCDWLPLVLPNMQPWMSTQIQRGSTWSTELLDSLREARSCIICVTSESTNSSWLAFEGGMLHAHSQEVPVVCLCLDVDPELLTGTPLGIFTPAVVFGSSGMRQLVEELNRTMLPPISTAVLQKFFDQSWGDLESKISKLPSGSVRKFELVFWTKTSTFSLQDQPLADGPWLEELDRIVESVGERAGVQGFELSQFRYLDLVAERWIQPPLKLSNIRTDRLAMIHSSIAEGWERTVGIGQSSARAVALLLKQSLDVIPNQLRARASLERELKSLTALQEDYCGKEGGYALALTQLSFYPAPGATIEIAGAGSGGWSALVTHEYLPDYFAFRIGDGGGQFAAAEEGILVKVTRSPT